MHEGYPLNLIGQSKIILLPLTNKENSCICHSPTHGRIVEFSVPIILADESQRVTIMHNFECFVCFDRSCKVEVTKESFRRQDEDRKRILAVAIRFNAEGTSLMVTDFISNAVEVLEVDHALQTLLSDADATAEKKLLVRCEERHHHCRWNFQ